VSSLWTHINQEFTPKPLSSFWGPPLFNGGAIRMDGDIAVSGTWTKHLASIISVHFAEESLLEGDVKYLWLIMG